MKKMWKRFVSLLLACTLLAGMLPLSASAAEKPEVDELKWVTQIVEELNEKLTGTVSFEEKGAIPIPGSDLYAVQYQRQYMTDAFITETIMFIVPGKGANPENCVIPDTDSTNSVWANSGAIGLYIADGVTEIGNHAFDGMSTLETVEFQDSTKLTKVGEYAFNNCDKVVGLSLDLSNVTTLGKYAFNNCERLGSGENNKGVTLSDELTTIPENAFNTCGLKNVNIPKSCTKIEKNAFAHNSLSEVEELVLPNGLVTIGESAFVVTMGSGETGIGITSLTIPSSVESIGANAFSGRRNLAEVTVEDDNVPNTELELGNAAFGFNESSAYATQGSIRDEQHPEIEYSGTIGTKFFLPEDLEKYFVNEVKCYTGDITPMKYVDTEPADCINAGYDIYKTTFNGATSDGKPVELTYHYPIPALGHDYGPITEVERTCEHDNYFEQYCERKNCPNKGVAVGSLRQNQEGPGLFDEKTNEQLSEEELNEYRLQFVKAEGHNWSVKSVVNPNMQEGQATTLYYVCENEEHRNGLDTYDSPFKIPLSGKTINALTTQSLNDLTNQLAGFSNDGMVEWAAPSDKKFGEEGERNEPVTFTIQTGVSEEWPVFTEAPVGEPEEATGNNEKLTVKINVTKDVLDLSGVSIVPNAANVDKPVNVEVRGFEEAEETGSVEYYVGDKWITEQPKTEGKYKVRVTFKYDEKMYDLPEESASEYPGEGYKLVNDKDSGSVWVEHSFEVSLNQINAAAVAISNLTYNGEKQNTLRIYGLEIGQKAVVTTTDKDGTEIKWEYTRQEGDQTTPVEGLSLLSAGTYNVKVVFSFPGEDSYADKEQELTVHIDHKPVEKPVPTQNMSYLPVKTARDAFGGQTSADWQFVDDGTYTHTGINAGSYTAKVKLTSDNYRWADENEDVREIEIPWTISPRQIVAPTLGQNYYIYQYGTWRNPLFLAAAAHPNYEFVTNEEDHTVKLVYIGNKDTDDYDQEAAVAYTAANAYHTNRGRYLVTVTLNARGNYVWFGNAPSDLTWTIAPATLTLPTIEAEDADYTGKPYDAGSLVTVEDGGVTLPGDVKKAEYQYSHDTTFRSPSNNAPINAGTYFVRQNYTYDTQNYNAQIPYASFTINKATAKMTFDRKEVSAPYTAQGTPLQQVTVSGLVEADTEKMETVLGDVKYTYKYSTEPNPNWESMEAQQITEPAGYTFTTVGYYQITATWGTGAVSNNYTAKDAIYTLTITQAANQSITLTPDEKSRWTAASDSALAKYTIEYGKAADFTVIGTAALDDADISYAVNGGSDVVSVDSGNGTVTIHQAGMATITVTAAETPNVGADSVDYTVTVEKATPTVNTNLTDDELTVAYTGKAIEGYDEAEATAANVVAEAKQPTGDITYTFYTDPECSDENKVTNGGGKDGNIPIAVGTYYMKATYPGDKNYTSAESEPVTVTVTKAQLTVDAEGYEGTYEGETHSAITIKSVTGNGTTLAQGQYTVKYAKTNTNIAPGADADVWQNTLITVKDVADSTSGSQYYWYKVQDTAGNYEPKIEQVNVSITPAALKPNNVPDSYSKTYDGDDGVETDLTGITVTGIFTEPISVTATGTYDNENADKDKTVTLTLTLSGTDGANIDWGNYSYNDQALTDGQITLTQTGAGTITPKAITVTGISAENRVYDGTTDVELKGEPKTEDTLFNEDKTVSLALEEGAKGQLQDATAGNGKAVSVGNDAVEITGEGSGNYSVTVSLPNLTVDIEKATPTVTITGASDNKLTVAYTGNPVNIAATVAGISDTDKPTGEVTFRSYKSVEAAQNDTTGTGGTKLEEMPSNGGPYYLRAFIAEETNYKAAVSDYVELVIDATALSVTTGKPAEKSYTGKEHNMAQWADMKVQFSGKDVQYDVVFLKKGEDETSAPDAEDEKWNSGVSAITNVAESGEYWYKVTAKEGEGNFNPHVSTSAITFTVTPATLTINRAVTPTKTYDGTVDADEQVTDVGVKGQQINEAITATVTSAFYNSAEVGSASKITITYKLEAKDGANLANYKLTGKEAVLTSGTVTEEVTKVNNTNVAITQKPIEVSINDQSKVYDGQFATASSDKGTAWTVNEDDLCELVSGTKDNLGITLSVAPDSKNAGTYAITGAWTNNNYAVTFAGSWKGEEHNGTAGTYTIDPRPIDVQIGDTEGFYGDVPVLDNVALDDVTGDGVSDAGLVDGEVLKNVLKGLELATTANAQSDISDEDTLYTIYAKKGGAPVQAPTQLGNYNVTFTNEGTYTVNPRPITITIEDHSSVYGEEINGGITTPVSGVDYTVAITNNATTGEAIVKGDNLEIKLTTEATADSPVDDYDITGSAAGEKVNNYAITWAGNGGDRDDEQGQNGRYTIKPAQLDIAFTQGDQVTNGVSINITDSYKDNPLVLKNDTTKTEVSTKDKKTLTIKYSIGLANGGTGDVSDIATIDETTGEVTIHSTGTVRVTAKVTANEGSNYTGTQTTWYELNIIGGGQMALRVTPATGLKYTGVAQELLASEASCTVAGAEIQYSLDNQDWDDEIPTGTNAGTYTVYVKATDPNDQYSDVTEHVTVTISKANLKGSFAQEEYTHVLTKGNSYDSATANELTIRSAGYGAEPAKYTYRSADTTVAMAENGGSTIRIMGSAGQETTITVTVPGDNNYNEGTFTYTLKISDKLSEIKYNVTGATTTYNGQPQTIAVNVTAPASGATVMYQDEDGNYTLSEPPAYTNVQEGGYPIKFQITAPGYNTVTGEAKLTINPRDISLCQVEGIAASYTFVNKPIEPQTVEVVDGSVILKEDTDYTITYGANKEVGESESEDLTNGGGYVKITGTGNYTGEVTKYFAIKAVDGSDLTASLDHTFGYYGDSSTNNATVTVTHGSHTVDSSEITLTVTREDSTTGPDDYVKDGLKLTFNKAGIYTIHVEVSGTHKGAFDLTYTLLPQDVASDDFQVATDPVDRVWTYDGENRAFGVTVTSGGTSLQKDVDFTLHYTYLPYVGNPTDDVYDPGTTAFTEAGIYTVIVEGTGNYTGHAELVALIQPRDLSDAGIAAAIAQTGLVYNGEAQEPDVTLTYNGAEISQLKDTEYYGNTNAGEAQALSAASEDCNNFTGARVDAFTIEKKSLKDSTITAKADPEEYYYTGYPVTPAVTVTDSGRNVDLSIGADYTVTSDAVGPGKVTATVTGTGNYKDTVTVEFTILPTGAEPVETLNLTVTPSEWTWDNGQTKAAISVTFNGKELNDTDYQLTVSKDGETPKTVTKAEAVELLSAPGKYTITATGVGAYNGSTDTETVTIQKIQPELTVTAAPETLSGGGKVTLTLKGEKLPAFAEGQDLSSLLTASAKDEKNAPDLSELEWETDEQTGVMTAELTLPNTNETYTFTLTFTGNEYYEAATASEQVVVAQQIISGGGGGPVEDQPADPDDTGVSDWLNTKDHLAYLAGYPGGTFGPDQNMTRAEAAQMFYNLLLEKDVEITVEFEDVPADAWYAKPVNTLASLGILSGVGNGRFDPERSITRAEFTVIAMKFANTSGGGVNIFSDVNEDDWFYSAVVDSTQYGWINGYPDGTFRPEATISRAEVTVIVNHMLGRAADRPYVIAHEEELNTFGDVNRGHWGYFHVAEATNAHEYHTEDGTESWTGLS